MEKTAAPAQDPKCGPASLLSSALVRSGQGGKKKKREGKEKKRKHLDFSLEELPSPNKVMLIDKLLEK